ncbi:hypothetical protein [Methanogenium organophilum]|uniref:Uncharacterized protein n=1 Tax=Methanogenium organophilum TaxID=2199 RepID=A0A9X9T7A4_METOG|nr:hypothetical protein [Methanogenium organophilum]WAI00221.1 hypothetical protein OU421_07190 [Methanogenium organophilum]
MASINITKILLVVVVGTIAIFLFGTFFGLAWINSNPGQYSYTITTEGLSQYQGGLVTDVIVPIPMRDGELVFPEEELQNQQFGSWKSVIVETPYGKMLAFQSVGEDLTDIDATFFRRYDPGELTVTDISEESLSPLICKNCDGFPEYVSVIYLPDELAPLSPDAPDIVINLKADVSEGLNHSILGETFRVTVHESIPPEIRGEINVSVVITRYEDGIWIPYI